MTASVAPGTSRPALAYAKINLTLEVRGRRPDGYHELYTLFQSIDVADEIRVAPDAGLGLTVDGDAPGGDANIVLRAAARLRAAAGTSQGARIELVKRIPSGAGLGGGSSDAATTLRVLDRLWKLDSAFEDLQLLAAELGADVPYFLVGGSALGRARGDAIEPIADLAPHAVVLGLAGHPVSTPAVFAAYAARTGSAPESAGPGPDRGARGAGFEGFRNDLEPVVFELHPALAHLKQTLARAGAAHALLSGSGGTVYGLYTDEEVASRAAELVRASGHAAIVARTLERRAFLAGQLGS